MRTKFIAGFASVFFFGALAHGHPQDTDPIQFIGAKAKLHLLLPLNGPPTVAFQSIQQGYYERGGQYHRPQIWSDDGKRGKAPGHCTLIWSVTRPRDRDVLITPPFVLVTSEISRMYNLSRWGDDNYVDIVFEPNPYIDSLTCNGRFGNPSIHDFKEMILGVFNYDPAPPVTR